jgi:hypothetical protein
MQLAASRTEARSGPPSPPATLSRSKHKMFVTISQTARRHTPGDSNIYSHRLTWLKYHSEIASEPSAAVTMETRPYLGRFDKFSAFPTSCFPVCNTTKRIFLGWVKEVKSVRGAHFFNPIACFLYKTKDLPSPLVSAATSSIVACRPFSVGR